MKLVKGVTQYIEYKQSIGMAFENDAKILRFFCRKIGDLEIGNVGADQVREFLDGSRPITLYWNRKYEALLGFYRYAMLRTQSTVKGDGYAAAELEQDSAKNDARPFANTLWRRFANQRSAQADDSRYQFAD